MRPVLRGLCRYESLIDEGPMTLVDIARMNDALDAMDENAERARRAARAAESSR